MNYGVSGSEAVYAENAKKRRRAAIRLVAVVLLVSVAVCAVIAFSVTNAQHTPGFKTITYDNQVGDRFQLEFYASHGLKYQPGADKGSKGLVSNIEVDGQYPLALYVHKTSQAPSSSTMTCAAQGISLDVKNIATGQMVHLCPVRNSLGPGLEHTTVYYGVMQSSSDYYVIVITQNYDFKKVTKSPESAREAVKKFNLPTYDKDITRIIASLKVLE
jgi:hypothetical protein